VFPLPDVAIELAPQEDQGIVLSQLIGPPDATLTQMQMYADQVFAAARALPKYDSMFHDRGGAVRDAGL